MGALDLITAHTIQAHPWLCPEIRLHLITEVCPLWRATEPELAALGIVDPFWAFAWAGGQALARYVLDHPAEVAGRRVLSFGAGSGLEAIAAMRAGAAEVLATEIDPLAVSAISLNAALNAVEIRAALADVIGQELAYDLILAGDVLYDGAFAARVLDWLQRCARQGATVWVGDPGRGHLGGARLEELARYQVPADVDTRGEILRSASVYRLV
ncbi:MAG: 50S ribosomal protein L11 methyltransferase [Myxococcota bacterium]